MGLMLSQILQVALTLANGGNLIFYAAVMTGVIFLSMYALAPRFAKASQMGGFLFVGLIVIIVASVVNLFVQMPVLHRR